jgi:hypothetical protein
MLKFHQTWKTKKWQTRMTLEIIGASLVDARLACRHLMPRETTESNFMAFVRDLTPQIDAQTEEQLDRDAGESSSEVQPDLMSPVAEFTICAHASTGRNGVRSNGEKHANQQRRECCSARGRRTNTTMRRKLHGAVVRIQIHARTSPKTAPAWQNTWERSLTWEINSAFEPPAGPHSLSSFSKSMM